MTYFSFSQQVTGSDLNTLQRDIDTEGTSVQAWTGNYGEYLTAKVSRVFPDLFSSLG